MGGDAQSVPNHRGQAEAESPPNSSDILDENRMEGSFGLAPGHIYATSSGRNDIVQLSPSGELVSTLAFPAYTARGLKGLAFSPRGRLYVVAAKVSGYDVLVLGQDGAVLNVFEGPAYVAGNSSYGKIAVGPDQEFYVAGQDQLRRFTADGAQSSVIYTGNQIYDVAVLPSGNLVVASAYSIHEITTNGAIVRQIAPQVMLTDVRGILYDPTHNDLYVTMLGFSDNFFRLMRIDLTSGVLEANVYFWYGDDLEMTSTGELLVGSNIQAPGRFSRELAQTGSLPTDQRNFIAALPRSESLFSSGFE
jgi:hypothetical protein